MDLQKKHNKSPAESAMPAIPNMPIPQMICIRLLNGTKHLILIQCNKLTLELEN